MTKRCAIAVVSFCLGPAWVFAAETAPRITDREIVERLWPLEEGQRSIEDRIGVFDQALNRRIDDFRRTLGKIPKKTPGNGRWESKCFNQDHP